MTAPSTRVRRAWSLIAACLAVIGFRGPVRADGVAVVASLVEPIARIDYGKSSGTAQLTLELEALSAAQVEQADLLGPLTDTGSDATKVRVARALELQPRGASTRYYVLDLAVSDLPANASQKRFLRFTVDGADELVAYTLTNTAAATFSWTPRAVPAIALAPGDAIPLSIAVGPVPATGVKAVQTALIENVGKTPIAADGLVLCRTPKPCDGKGIDLPPLSPNQLWLVAVGGPGQYGGSVTVAANEKPEGDAVAMTVYSSSLAYKLGGVAVIFAGVVLAWYFTFYVRSRLNRDQLLVPVASLVATLDRLSSRLVKRPSAQAPNTAAKIADLKTNVLSLTALEQQGLPAAVPTPWTSPTAPPLSAYQTYVQAASDWVTALTIVVGGIERAVDMDPSGSKPQATADAVGRLDALVTGSIAPAAGTLSAGVEDILGKLRAEVSSAGIRKLAPDRASPRSAQLPSLQMLQLDVRRLGSSAWLFIAAATTLVGAYVLVFSAAGAGFGTPVDYLVCLLWGFGLPTGSTLAGSTTSTVTTAFNVAK